MVDSNGYIMFDLSCLDFSKHNQIIDGIYQRTFEVIGAYKFVILLGVQGKTPIPACVSFTNGSYVIESFIYNFAITSDDNVRIENVSSDIIKDGVISAGTTWSSQKINNEMNNIIDDELISDFKTWSSQKINNSIGSSLHIMKTNIIFNVNGISSLSTYLDLTKYYVIAVLIDGEFYSNRLTYKASTNSISCILINRLTGANITEAVTKSGVIFYVDK